MPGLSEILKASIGATDTTLSGTLTPEQAHNFIDVIKDNSKILQDINLVKMGRLTKELDAWDVAKGILVRVPSGKRPTEAQRQKLGVIGTKLEAKNVQLFARILQDALEENKHNSKFESETFNAFSKAFGNDLALLGFTGSSDTYDDSFETLHKGWVQIAKDSEEATKLTYAADDEIKDILLSLVKAIPEDIKGEAVIFINPADLLSYNVELSSLNSPAHLIEAGASKIGGIKLYETSLIKKGTFLATPLKNLILGTVLDIRRNRWYDPEERALKYVFDVAVDYEIAVKKWVVLMEKEVG